MGLAPISEDKYTEFAIRLFEKGGKRLEGTTVHEVYSRFSGVTSCLQRVMNVLYFRTSRGDNCTPEMVGDAINYLLDLYSENYETQLSQMSEKQRIVFRSIVAEGKAKNVTGGAFIKKYHLWSASSVMSALKALLDKDFITQEDGVYMAYDQFFAMWILR